MKGGIAAFIEASSMSHTPVKILLGVDEEEDSAGAWAVVNQQPDFFNGINLIVSAEPSFGLKPTQITSGRTGRVLYDAHFKGKSEHIMKYDEAIDSIEKLAFFANQLYSKRDISGTFASNMTILQIRKVEGAAIGMSVCGDASAVIEALLGPEDNQEDILAFLKTLTKDKENDEITIRPRKTPYLKGYQFTDFPESDIIAKVIKNKFGSEMELVFRRSVADDNILATLNIPVITWGPQGGNEHKPNEYIESQSLVNQVDMYKQFLDRIGETNE